MMAWLEDRNLPTPPLTESDRLWLFVDTAALAIGASSHRARSRVARALPPRPAGRQAGPPAPHPHRSWLPVTSGTPVGTPSTTAQAADTAIPRWYVPRCIGYDVVVAVYILIRF